MSTVDSKEFQLLKLDPFGLSFLILYLSWLRIQYLPAHEKDQIQDIRSWVQSDPEATLDQPPSRQ